jgi:hypothetical protein
MRHRLFVIALQHSRAGRHGDLLEYASFLAKIEPHVPR